MHLVYSCSEGHRTDHLIFDLQQLSDKYNANFCSYIESLVTQMVH